MIKPAGLVIRLGAWVLDLFFIAILMVVFGSYEVDFFPNLASIDTNAAAVGALLYIFWATLVLYGLIELVSGRSPAKWILGMSVRRKEGGKASSGRRFVRYLGNIAAFMFIPAMGMFDSDVLSVALLGLSVIFILGVLPVFGPAKRTLADYLAGTALFRGKSQAA